MGAIYSKTELDEIRKITLEQFFYKERPDDIVKTGNGRYSIFYKGEWRTSIATRPDGFWSFFSESEKGHGALDWLITMEGMSFLEACMTLVGPPRDDIESKTPEEVGEDMRQEIIKRFGEAVADARSSKEFYNPDIPKHVKIPPRADNNTAGKQYLQKRGIDPGIISYIERKNLFYTERTNLNAVFVGFDWNGIVKTACKRGTKSSAFKGEAKDSDKRYTFRTENPIRNSVHFFESPIDLLSYATYMKKNKAEWRLENLVSLDGIAVSTKQNSDGYMVKLPPAMIEFLEHNKGKIKTIHLHLDNDLEGRTATLKFKEVLEKEGYKVIDEPAPKGKDWNDFINDIDEIDSKNNTAMNKNPEETEDTLDDERSIFTENHGHA